MLQLKKIIYLIFCIVCIHNSVFGSVLNIEKQLSDCLKDKYSAYDMTSCSENARKNLDNEIKLAENKLYNDIKYKQNKIIWEKYKKSHNQTIVKILNQMDGTFYQELAFYQKYDLSKNRLFLLEYYLKYHPYQEESYISNELQTCLTKANSDNLKIKCYVQETDRYSKISKNLLSELKSSLSANDYKILIENQKIWLEYKTSTIKLFENYPSLIQAQILEIIMSERNGQLQSLKG